MFCGQGRDLQKVPCVRWVLHPRLHPPAPGAVQQGGRASVCVEGRGDGERLSDPDGVFQTTGPGAARPLLGPGLSQVSGGAVTSEGLEGVFIAARPHGPRRRFLKVTYYTTRCECD